MSNLYLGLQGLAPADMKLLKVFLRFAGKTDRHQWALSLDEPEDLVLRQTARQGETLPMGLDPVVQAPVAWILGPGEDATGFDGFTLQRPLQMEPFAALLRAREAQIDAAARRQAAAQQAPERVVTLRAVVAPAPAPAPSARVAATGPVPSARGAAPAAAAVAPAFAITPELLATSMIVDDPQVAYRLLKWPGTDLMRGQPKFVRMLAFLTHKPLSVRRLRELSGVDDATCIAMLTLLDARGLLAHVDADIDAAPAADERAPEAATPSTLANVVALPERAAPRAPAAAAQSGLFQRLRKRLGLG